MRLLIAAAVVVAGAAPALAQYQPIPSPIGGSSVTIIQPPMIPPPVSSGTTVYMPSGGAPMIPPPVSTPCCR